ncbi:Predicted dithiol-disulfide isomerase, DsbA family [Lentibacillus halodurans]|uniref:ClpXP adapter protein SpxH n=1 Tax=Lentibacillus halodurans TaxID=237679 RepID=A0A1I0W1Y2_9BACI|nr:ClpXP adapter SpxH family protein [Lentibacillus halodurans]SFA82622.1 Predicted dithiol-disulfide isomerase, DsbA family [Lentibacillus halodurans]
MSWNQPELSGSNHTSTSPQYSYIDFVQKPVEIYVFIDPLCPECWSLEPYLKKLSIEYGRFFTLQPILSGQLNSLNKDLFDRPKQLKQIWEKIASRTGMSCDGDLWTENEISAPWVASMAVKAAELQGKKAGKTFLRRVQESAFLGKENISDMSVLKQCAREANLDIQEFEDDLYSQSAKKAFQSDLKLTREMEVDYIPTIVFFNQRTDEQGIKVSGLYPYDIYVQILKQILQKDPVPSSKPPLENFVQYYHVVGSKEVSVVYDWSETETDKEMKKMQLRQYVKKIPVKYGTFWKYIDE